MAFPTMANVDENLETSARRRNAVVAPGSSVNPETPPYSAGIGAVRCSEDSQNLRGIPRRQEFPAEWTMCAADEESSGSDSGSDKEACSFGNEWDAQGD